MSEAVVETYAEDDADGGRLAYRSIETLDEICVRLTAGEPLAQICRDPRMPTVMQVYHWSRRDPTVEARVSRAREFGADSIAVDALDIADCATGDVARDKLRVETRLKLLAKWNPKKYGDNVQLRHADADGEKLNTQPLVSELLTMLGPGGSMQAAVKLEAPGIAPVPPRIEHSAFGTPLIEATPIVRAEPDPSQAQPASSPPASAPPAKGYRPRAARPRPVEDDVADLV